MPPRCGPSTPRRRPSPAFLGPAHAAGVGGRLDRLLRRHRRPPGRPAHLRLPAPALLAGRRTAGSADVDRGRARPGRPPAPGRRRPGRATGTSGSSPAGCRVDTQPWLAAPRRAGHRRPARHRRWSSWRWPPARQVGCPVVDELTLEAPLLLAEGVAVQVQVTVGPAGADGRRAVAVYSRPEARRTSRRGDLPRPRRARARGGDGRAGRRLAGRVAAGRRRAAVGGRRSTAGWPTRLRLRAGLPGPAGGLAARRRGVRRGRAARRRPAATAFGLHPALLDAALQRRGPARPTATTGTAGCRSPGPACGSAAPGATALRVRLGRRPATPRCGSDRAGRDRRAGGCRSARWPSARSTRRSWTSAGARRLAVHRRLGRRCPPSRPARRRRRGRRPGRAGRRRWPTARRRRRGRDGAGPADGSAPARRATAGAGAAAALAGRRAAGRLAAGRRDPRRGRGRGRVARPGRRPRCGAWCARRSPSTRAGSCWSTSTAPTTGLGRALAGSGRAAARGPRRRGCWRPGSARAPGAGAPRPCGPGRHRADHRRHRRAGRAGRPAPGRRARRAAPAAGQPARRGRPGRRRAGRRADRAGLRRPGRRLRRGRPGRAGRAAGRIPRRSR